MFHTTIDYVNKYNLLRILFQLCRYKYAHVSTRSKDKTFSALTGEKIRQKSPRYSALEQGLCFFILLGQNTLHAV